MFKNTYQNGLLSIFYSCGSQPLALWDMEVKNGHIKRLTDTDVNSLVLEIVSTNVATTYISCPPNNRSLGIKLPFLVMIVKNLKRYFSFEITVLDDKNMRRRFRISNFQSTTKIKPFCTSMPIGLAGGWNQIQFNLSDFTRRAYGSQFVETLRVQVHANVRLRRIYFAERLYTEDELPQDYKLYLPLEKGGKPVKGKSKKDTAMITEVPAPKDVVTEVRQSETIKSEPIPEPSTPVEQEKPTKSIVDEVKAPEEAPEMKTETEPSEAKAESEVTDVNTEDDVAEVKVADEPTEIADHEDGEEPQPETTIENIEAPAEEAPPADE